MVDHLFNNKFNLKWNDKENGYHIAPSNDNSFFPDRQANIYLKGKLVGVILTFMQIFGIVHPKVLLNFKIKNPVSIAEIEIETIFNMITNGEILQANKQA